MRIACPSCRATYEVPDALLRDAARSVRCARCATEWVPPPPAEAPAAPETAPAPVSAPDLAMPIAPPVAAAPPPADVHPVDAPAAQSDIMAPLAPKAPRPHGRGQLVVIILAWVASVAVLGGLGASAVLWRADIMAIWPPSQLLYGLLGLL